MSQSHKFYGPTQIGLQDLLRASHVKRWHIVQTAREQTLAEHNYAVATLALALYNDVVGDDLTAAPREIAMLVVAALFHDAPEVRTGDIPTPAKRMIRHFAGEDIFDKIENHINREVPLVGGVVSDSLYNFIRMADTIEAAVWIRENGLGARAKEVADKCWRNMEDLTNQLQIGTGQDWRSAVNKALDALLAPRLVSTLS
jgi:5'-deoxynucleotidase YfbR-like HD superfamily hydrolase